MVRAGVAIGDRTEVRGKASDRKRTRRDLGEESCTGGTTYRWS